MRFLIEYGQSRRATEGVAVNRRNRDRVWVFMNISGSGKRDVEGERQPRETTRRTHGDGSAAD